jgi:hypothetical protein
MLSIEARETAVLSGTKHGDNSLGEPRLGGRDIFFAGYPCLRIQGPVVGNSANWRSSSVTQHFLPSWIRGQACLRKLAVREGWAALMTAQSMVRESRAMMDESSVRRWPQLPCGSRDDQGDMAAKGTGPKVRCHRVKVLRRCSLLTVAGGASGFSVAQDDPCLELH